MPEPVTDIGGILIPSTNPIFLAVVGVHIAFGLTCVVAGAVAMLSAKGAGRHPWYGSVYFWSLGALFVTSSGLAIVRWPEDYHLFILGGLAFAFALFGRTARRRRWPAWARLHMTGMGDSYVLMLTAFLVDNGKFLPVWRALPPLALWFVPSVIGLPILVYNLIRHPLVRRADHRASRAWSFAVGLAVGTAGGLIGLGGAEFRLPLLIGLFGFGPLEAVILNKAMSLVVVAFSLVFRAGTIPLGTIAANWPVILNLLAGSLLGAWFGASWALRLRSETLYHVIAVLLVAIAGVLLLGHGAEGHAPLVTGIAQAVAGVIAGFVIGVVAALLGVAGGELLIPTLILLFGADIKLAGSLSLAVSLPTMIVGFIRYSRDKSFVVIARNRTLGLAMAAGSIAGSFVGGLLLGIVPTTILLPVLAAILVFSAFKVWGHRNLS